MIQIQPIGTNDATHYAFMEQLLVASFPPEEYRVLSQLREYTDQVGHFHNNIIIEEHTPIGLITYWDFEQFYYIEHFAIDPNLRNGGYGKKVLQQLHEQFQSPIVLEVEKPTDEMTQRRIGFYQRHGFVLWENEYQQPPYKSGDEFLPLQLMVHGELQSDKDFEFIRKRIYQDVYNAVID